MPTALPTRQRILDTARQLFTEQGYDGTSLREIAEPLGFSKAALYYHFKSKEEILAALMEPANVLLHEFLDRLESAATLEEWAAALDWVVDQLPEQMPLFRLLARNRASIDLFAAALDHRGEHVAIHERIDAALSRSGAPLADRIRMIAGLAAVSGFDDWAPTLMMETDPAVLVVELKLVVRQILGLPVAAPEPEPVRAPSPA
jgi:AcrR family transcriptional regulator